MAGLRIVSEYLLSIFKSLIIWKTLIMTPLLGLWIKYLIYN